MSSATASDWSDDCDATGSATGGAAPDTANAPTVAPIHATAITAASHMGLLGGLAAVSGCELTRGSGGRNGGSPAVKAAIDAPTRAPIEPLTADDPPLLPQEPRVNSHPE